MKKFTWVDYAVMIILALMAFAIDPTDVIDAGSPLFELLALAGYYYWSKRKG